MLPQKRNEIIFRLWHSGNWTSCRFICFIIRTKLNKTGGWITLQSQDPLRWTVLYVLLVLLKKYEYDIRNYHYWNVPCVKQAAEQGQEVPNALN